VASDEWRAITSKKKPGKNIYTEGTEDAESTERREERTRRAGASRNIEERFLAAQADRFAGANRFRNIGPLRSE